MKTENRYYDVTPRILPADSEAEITIRPLYDHCGFAAGKPYGIQHYLMDDSPTAPKSALAGTYAVKPDKAGRLRFRGYFAGEQEHWVRVTPPPAQNTPAIDFRLFSLQPDLFRRRPFKGDFHIHSNRSDGRESPAYVAAACRRIGLDFMAVTDHYRYAPSLEAMRAFANVKHDLRIFPGEEVHPPEVPVHLVNFGGAFSVNALFKTARYRRDLRTMVAEMAATCRPAVDPYQAAACMWSGARTREGGGLSIFCHPYWISGSTYNVSASLNEWMFAHQPFDAFELIGGYHRYELDCGELQVAWYNEQRLKGRNPPVVGASDAHGCECGELFSWYYSIVFSPSLDDLLESVRQGYSVAVQSLPGDIVRPTGRTASLNSVSSWPGRSFPFMTNCAPKKVDSCWIMLRAIREPARRLPG